MTQTIKKKLLKTSNFTLFFRKFERKYQKISPAAAIYRGNFCPARYVGKELDNETGLYYYGARYLDPRVSRWLSGDPAMGEYVPAKGQDPGRLGGMGGVFNTINMHVYHYAANNPVKYYDPDGRESENVERWRQEYIARIKSGETNTFTQRYWQSISRDENNDLNSTFWASACFATSLLNTVARAYAIENNREMTVQMGEQLMLAAVGDGVSGAIDAGGWVKSQQKALNIMAEGAGIQGTLVYSEENIGWSAMQIYSLWTGGYSDVDKKIQSTHFVNAISGENRYYDVWNGRTGTLGKEPPNVLTTERSIRWVQYIPHLQGRWY